MKKNNLTAIFTLLITPLFLSHPSFAEGGSSGSHGGNAVVCYSDISKQNILSVELFDYWEGRQTPGARKVDLGGEQLSVQEKIDLFVSRVAEYDPTLSVQIKNNAAVILTHIDEYLIPGEPPKTDDYTPKKIPSGFCSIEPFAAQRTDPNTQNRRFSISNRLYSNALTSNDARAGIILHEAIYRIALQQGHTNSDLVRDYHYAIATGMLTGNIDNSYQDLALKNRMYDVHCKAIKLPYYNQRIILMKKDPTDENNTSRARACLNTVIRFPEFIGFIAQNAQLTLSSGFDGDRCQSTEYAATCPLSAPLRRYRILDSDRKWIERSGGVISIGYGGYIAPTPNGTRQPTPVAPKVVLSSGETIQCRNESLTIVDQGGWSWPHFTSSKVVGCTLEGNATLPVGAGTGRKIQLDNGARFLYDTDENLIIAELLHPTELGIHKAKSTALFIGTVKISPLDGGCAYGNLAPNQWIPVRRYRAGEWVTELGRGTFINRENDSYPPYGYNTFFFKSENLEKKLGAPILSNASERTFGNYCIGLGYDEPSNMTNKTVLVGGRSKFYDLNTQSYVYRIDEPVDVYSNPTCEAEDDGKVL